jgi:hypothetical protein
MVNFYFSITDSSGNPVTTAFVVGVDKINQPYYAPTDLNGNAVVSIPANIWGNATYIYTVVADGYTPQCGNTGAVNKNQNINVVLQKSGQGCMSPVPANMYFYGFHVEDSSGNPIQGASVVLYGGLLNGTTNNAGNVVFESYRSGVGYSISASGYTGTSGTGSISSSFPIFIGIVSLQSTSTPPPSTNSVDVIFSVTDTSGNPISGATIVANHVTLITGSNGDASTTFPLSSNNCVTINYNASASGYQSQSGTSTLCNSSVYTIHMSLPPQSSSTGSGCTSNSQCSSGYICQNGQCVPQPTQSGCTSNSECPTGYICVNGICVSPQNTGCTSNSQCSNGYICVNGQCIQETACSSTVPCPSGFACSNGVCVPVQSQNTRIVCVLANYLQKNNGFLGLGIATGKLLQQLCGGS